MESADELGVGGRRRSLFIMLKSVSSGKVKSFVDILRGFLVAKINWQCNLTNVFMTIFYVAIERSFYFCVIDRILQIESAR